jgi:hypothetical protein
MKTTKSRPFEGVWDVTSLEYRIHGEWVCEFEPGADEWSLGFLADGRYLDIYRPDDDRESGLWTFDEATGVITILYDGSKCTSNHIFDETGEGAAYLYCFGAERHIRPDRDTILAHHAHSRQKLVRAYSYKEDYLPSLIRASLWLTSGLRSMKYSSSANGSMTEHRELL